MLDAQRAAIAARLAVAATCGDRGLALGISPDAARMRVRRAGLQSIRPSRKPDPETLPRAATSSSTAVPAAFGESSPWTKNA